MAKKKKGIGKKERDKVAARGTLRHRQRQAAGTRARRAREKKKTSFSIKNENSTGKPEGVFEGLPGKNQRAHGMWGKRVPRDDTGRGETYKIFMRAEGLKVPQKEEAGWPKRSPKKREDLKK